MSVYLDPGIRVEIVGDYDLVSEFLKWQLDNEVFPFRGGHSGRGNLVEWFPKGYETQLIQFFGDRLGEDDVEDNS